MKCLQRSVSLTFCFFDKYAMYDTTKFLATFCFFPYHINQKKKKLVVIHNIYFKIKLKLLLDNHYDAFS